MISVIALMAEALAAMEPAVELVANEGEYGGECVEYTFNTTAYNGARREARMKLNIVAASMARGLEIETMLDRLLVRPRERALTPTCVSCARNGGGWLPDGDWHIRIAYYDLVFRA